MGQYIIVYKNSKIIETDAAEQLSSINPDSVLFICRKESIIRFRYGSHNDYIICDKTGRNSACKIGEYSIISFKTHGTQSNFMLSWNLIHDGENEEYTLRRDDRLFIVPFYDQEWRNPIKETIKLINDIQTIGLPTRRELDELLRNLYQQNIELDIAWDHHRFLGYIDYEKSGSSLRYRPEQLPPYHKNYKELVGRFIKEPHKAISFLKNEYDQRARALSLLIESNQKYESGVSSLTHIYLKNGLYKVEGEQFYACIKAETITLPPSLQIIETTAFNYLLGLKAVFITSKEVVHWEPPFYRNGRITFKGCFYVPRDLLSTYKSSFTWRGLSEHLLPI